MYLLATHCIHAARAGVRTAPHVCSQSYDPTVLPVPSMFKQGEANGWLTNPPDARVPSRTTEPKTPSSTKMVRHWKR